VGHSFPTTVLARTRRAQHRHLHRVSFTARSTNNATPALSGNSMTGSARISPPSCSRSTHRRSVLAAMFSRGGPAHPRRLGESSSVPSPLHADRGSRPRHVMGRLRPPTTNSVASSTSPVLTGADAREAALLFRGTLGQAWCKPSRWTYGVKRSPTQVPVATKERQDQ
jgi:hypothetical protein